MQDEEETGRRVSGKDKPGENEGFHVSTWRNKEKEKERQEREELKLKSKFCKSIPFPQIEPWL